MAGPTVYEDIAELPLLDGVGQLFAGKKFWVAQRVPFRNSLLDRIKANGGEVVLLEKKADYLIADHLRRDCPPGSISYDFVDKSIKDGQLRDPADHRAGPPLGEAREAGAASRPTKGGRAQYTAEEDRMLYKWVRDCEANGGLASGNEIYKQLEAKHPRHTWQSWRDRYLKQLRTRPPSAFNIPDNAPPSPPSDNSPDSTSRPAPAAPKREKKVSPRKERAHSPDKVAGEGRPRDARKNPKYEYSIDELEAIFSAEDWQELYAYVDIIKTPDEHLHYRAGWDRLADSRDNQTAEQWRQYYEKVVRPQWLRDPQWKRDRIYRKMERKHGRELSPEQSVDEQSRQAPEETGLEATSAASSMSPKKLKKPSEAEDERFEEERYKQMLAARRSQDDDAAAYIFFAREHKWPTWNAQPGLNYVQLHEQLMSQWQSLPEAEKAQYREMNQSTKKSAEAEAAKISSEADAKLMSSSTAQYESPKKVEEIYQNTLKRVRDGYVDEEVGQQEQELRAVKHQKTASPSPERNTSHAQRTGTQHEPVEVLSIPSSTSASQPEEDDERAENQIIAEAQRSVDAAQTLLRDDHVDTDEEVNSVKSNDSLDIDRLPLPIEAPNLPSDDDLPSDTPTPGASRQKRSNFDTQAILSSPSQGIGITKLPRPVGYTQDLETQPESRSSSIIPHPHSEASTTQSIEEFRRSLNGEHDADSNPLPRLPSLTPSQDPESAEGDPDPPMSADEINAFFAHFNDAGFADEFIIAALKRTQFRPELAERVLDAWKVGDALPVARGIWSLADDEAAEFGDREALARLVDKHTMDGWGGVTERLKFFEGYRSR